VGGWARCLVPVALPGAWGRCDWDRVGAARGRGPRRQRDGAARERARRHARPPVAGWNRGFWTLWHARVLFVHHLSPTSNPTFITTAATSESTVWPVSRMAWQLPSSGAGRAGRRKEDHAPASFHFP